MHLKFRPKLDKIVEVILYIAHKKPGADKYQIVKFMYLSDREHLSRYGRPITQEVYYALPYGPVASKAMDMLEGDRSVLRDVGIEELPVELVKKAVGARMIHALGAPRRDFDSDLFSKSDLKILDEIILKYGDFSFDELYRLTHKHYAYTKAWNGRRPHSNRSLMYYEDMIEDEDRRREILEDLGSVSEFME